MPAIASLSRKAAPKAAPSSSPDHHSTSASTPLTSSAAFPSLSPDNGDDHQTSRHNNFKLSTPNHSSNNGSSSNSHNGSHPSSSSTALHPDSSSSRTLANGPGAPGDKSNFEAFEIEDDDEDLEAQREGCRTRIFPFDTLKYCCPTWIDCIPGPFRVLQGWTHLILLVGVYSTTLLMVWCLLQLYGDIQAASRRSTQARVEKAELQSLETILSLVSVTPCMWYFLQTIRQYDQDLNEKKKEVQSKRKELMADFQTVLGSLDDFLGETLRKTLDTAELGFELKQREFSRFLEELMREWGEDMNSPSMVAELRRFCVNWSFLFAECSIHPLDRPRLVATKAELDQCATLGTIFNKMRTGCEEAQAEFIMSKKKNDEELCKENRRMFEKLTSKGNVACKVSGSLKPACFGNGLSWITFGCTNGAELRARYETDEGFFPKVIPYGLGHIIFLSMSHIWLIVAVAAFPALFAWELVMPNTRISTLAVWAFIEVCLIVVLFRFEDIDLVSQLQREIADLKREKAQILEQNIKMKEDWSEAQVCTDIWIYRTLPRLTVYSEVHSYFENASLTQFAQDLNAANEALEKLDKRLPPLQEWRNDGGLEIAHKKEFRQIISNVSRQRTLADVLGQLEKQGLPWEEC